MAHEGQMRVMIVLDASEAADNAFEWYLENMKQPHDYVYGLIIPENDVTVNASAGADTQALTDLVRSRNADVEKLCAEYTDRLRTNRVEGQVEVVQGYRPGVFICEHADKWKIDNIVIGVHGLSNHLGSVSNYVLQCATVPVSVIP